MNLKERGTLVIGIGHRARQGKSWLAYSLVQGQYPRRRVYGFADALKAYCRIEYGMIDKNPTLLQRVGSEKRRENPSIWINALVSQIIEDKPRVAFICDLRYRNEMEWIYAQSGLCVRVDRIMPDGQRFIAPDRDPRHESEVDLLDAKWDYCIEARDGRVGMLAQRAYECGLIEQINWIESDMMVGEIK